MKVYGFKFYGKHVIVGLKVRAHEHNVELLRSMFPELKVTETSHLGKYKQVVSVIRLEGCAQPDVISRWKKYSLSNKIIRLQKELATYH